MQDCMKCACGAGRKSRGIVDGRAPSRSASGQAARGRSSGVWSGFMEPHRDSRSDQANHPVDLSHVDALQGEGVSPLVRDTVALEGKKGGTMGLLN